RWNVARRQFFEEHRCCGPGHSDHYKLLIRHAQQFVKRGICWHSPASFQRLSLLGVACQEAANLETFRQFPCDLQEQCGTPSTANDAKFDWFCHICSSLNAAHSDAVRIDAEITHVRSIETDIAFGGSDIGCADAPLSS